MLFERFLIIEEGKIPEAILKKIADFLRQEKYSPKARKRNFIISIVLTSHHKLPNPKVAIL